MANLNQYKTTLQYTIVIKNVTFLECTLIHLLIVVFRMDAQIHCGPLLSIMTVVSAVVPDQTMHSSNA